MTAPMWLKKYWLFSFIIFFSCKEDPLRTSQTTAGYQINEENPVAAVGDFQFSLLDGDVNFDLELFTTENTENQQIPISNTLAISNKSSNNPLRVKWTLDKAWFTYRPQTGVILPFPSSHIIVYQEGKHLPHTLTIEGENYIITFDNYTSAPCYIAALKTDPSTGKQLDYSSSEVSFDLTDQTDNTSTTVEIKSDNFITDGLKEIILSEDTVYNINLTNVALPNCEFYLPSKSGIFTISTLNKNYIKLFSENNTYQTIEGFNCSLTYEPTNEVSNYISGEISTVLYDVQNDKKFNAEISFRAYTNK